VAGQKAGADTHARRLAALGEANRIRTERSVIKAALRAGEARAAPLLLDPPDSLQTASVAEVLLAVPGVGQVKLRRLLTSCRLSPGSKLGRLSVRQRQELVQLLGSLA
jgi:hypothetical protein